MGDLHSITYTSNLHSSSLGWDFHGLGVFNSDMSHFMDSSSTSFLSPDFYDFDHHSTGYLQDALFELHDKTKRRRLLFDHQCHRTTNFIEQESYWELNQAENYPENTSYLSQMTEPISEIFEVKKAASEEEVSVSEVFDYSSSSPKDSSDTTNFMCTKDHCLDENFDEENEKRVMTRIVYPFAVIKPGGIEGDLTLNDINRRILMTPTRPVKHPVGDYACRPMVVSPNGPGLSGKAVVALTRLYTRGHRGTITIIRTKG